MAIGNPKGYSGANDDDYEDGELPRKVIEFLDSILSFCFKL